MVFDAKAFNEARDQRRRKAEAYHDRMSKLFKENRIQREYDHHIYTERHLVECFFAKIKGFRGVSTRYDKLEELYRAGLLSLSLHAWFGCNNLETAPNKFLHNIICLTMHLNVVGLSEFNLRLHISFTVNLTS